MLKKTDDLVLGDVPQSGAQNVAPHLLNTSDDGKCDKPEPEEKVNLLVDDVHLAISSEHNNQR